MRLSAADTRELLKLKEAIEAKRKQDGLHGRIPFARAEVAYPPELETLKDAPSPVEVETVPDAPEYPDRVKVWGLLGISAIQSNRGGAWRLWTLSKALDKRGSGWIDIDSIVGFLRFLGVSVRTRQRWTRAALKLGLLKRDKAGEVYYLAGLADAARAVGSDGIGMYSTVRAEDLVKRGSRQEYQGGAVVGEDRAGWRSYVWAAYLSSHRRHEDKRRGSMVSQKRRAELTGVAPRTQRKYQSMLAVKARRNYAETGRSGDAQAAGLREITGRVYFVNKYGRVMQRIPDSLSVPDFAARSGKVGRGKKAQRKLNQSSCIVGRGNGSEIPLFHATDKQLKQATRRAARIDSLDGPSELFKYAYGLDRYAIWDRVSLA